MSAETVIAEAIVPYRCEECVHSRHAKTSKGGGNAIKINGSGRTSLLESV